MLCKQCSTRIGADELFCKDCGHEGYEPSFSDHDYASALERVWSEAETRLGRPMAGQHSIKTMVDLWQYAKSRIDLKSGEITADQAAWRLLHKSTRNTLRQGDAALMEKLEDLDQRRDALRVFGEAVEAAKRAHPNDYGFKAPLCFMLIGALFGFLRSREITSVLIDGTVSWTVGLFVSIFVVNSPAVQISLGFRLEGTMFTRLGRWLIYHSVKDYSEG